MTEKTRICPKCGSVDVSFDFSNSAGIAYGTPGKYKCGKCGFSAMIFPEIDKEETEEFRKQMKKSD